ncbi:hypothetical protein HY637_06200 [Candidatus Woesearchaeota archaeon]|nr:hypothetical protein [Candidatus Woesearchaeota archaeon]
MPEQTFQKRQVAYKVRISYILNSNFAKDDSSAGYLKLGNLNVSRVNVIANIVYKSEQGNSANAIIDDGTGKISLRIFENNDIFSKADVGDFVLVIGRVREFGNERYVLPEILRKIEDNGWVNLRKLELINVNFEGNVLNAVAGAANLSEDVYMLIKNLDKGEGVEFGDVIKNSQNLDAEHMINKLLESGDVFEVKPGRLKVLE